MKLDLKKHVGKTLTFVVLSAVLCGCGQSRQNSVIPEVVPYDSANAASVLSDIATTQYFTDAPVAQKDIETIVQAGIQAPSAMNTQPWHFSVITDAAVLKQISDDIGFGVAPKGNPGGEIEPPEGMTFPGGQPPAAPGGGGGTKKAGITDAPLVIVISCKEGSALDAGLACQNMSATAQLLGYGSKILTSPTMTLNGTNQEAYRQLLGIPEAYSAAAILLIGKEDTSVDEGTDGYTGATTRNPMDAVVTYITGES